MMNGMVKGGIIAAHCPCPCWKAEGSVETVHYTDRGDQDYRENADKRQKVQDGSQRDIEEFYVFC